MHEVVFNIIGALLAVVVVMATAPWWVRAVGPLIERWMDWVVKKMDDRDA